MSKRTFAVHQLELSKYKIQWLAFLVCSVIFGTVFTVSEDKIGTVSTAL